MNFHEQTAAAVQAKGFTVSHQDIQRAYWRDRQAAHRGRYQPPSDAYQTAKYLIVNNIAKPR